MRRLTLHASALNDDEYSLYTSQLKEIAEIEGENGTQGLEGDDAYFEGIILGVREVRAWLRGRYSSLPAGTIDTILQYFSPNLAHADTLTGGQFFAAIRLVVHAQNGENIDRALAFVQARTATSRPASPKKQAPRPPPPRRLLTGAQLNPQPSQYPPLLTPETPSNLFSAQPKAAPRSEDGSAARPPLPPRKSAPAQQTTFSHGSHGDGPAPPVPLRIPPNPIEDATRTSIPMKQNLTAPLPLRHELHGEEERSQQFLPSLPLGASPAVQHPLPSRFSPQPPSNPVGHVPSTLMKQGLPPPQLVTSPSAQASRLPPQPPPKPVGHFTSTLMKQSLQASKVAQTMKRAEEQLEKERIMQVLKSSNTASSAGPSKGPFRPPKPRSQSPAQLRRAGTMSVSSHSSEERYRPSPPPRRQSPSISASSLEQVALAAPPVPFSTRPSPFATNVLPSTDFTQSPYSSPSRNQLELPGPPPTHPDRKPPPLASTMAPERPKALDAFDAVYGTSTSSPATTTVFTTPFSTPSKNAPKNDVESPTARVFRSKSLHHPTPPRAAPPSVPEPPLRRKRPESVQGLSRSEDTNDEPTVDRDYDDDEPARVFEPPPRRRGNTGLSRDGSFTSSRGGHHRSSLSVSSVGSNPRSGPTSTFSHPNSTSNSTSTSTSSPLNMKSVIASLQSNKLNDRITGKFEQLQPKLEKARYKAEAGLSRRGFVGHQQQGSSGREDEEGLMGGRGRVGGTRASASNEKNVFEDSVNTSEDSDEFWARRGSPVEQDNLKWPVAPGEGWRPL